LDTTWTQIIPGNFAGPSRAAGLTDLLFYDATNGTGAFFVPDGVGRIRLLKEHTNWRRTWTRIVPGHFGGNNFTDLLFYEAALGTGEFYVTDGRGNLTDGRGNFRPLGRHTGWRQSWAQIIPGNFGGSGNTDLLFYDPSGGTGEFYTTDGSGGMSRLQTYTDWRTTWTQIIPGHFGGDGHTDLLFYDPTAATGEFYKTDGHGGISLLTQYENWRRTWQIIVPEMYAPGLGVRVHVKILQNPNMLISTMIAAMREVYATAGIRVIVGSTETMDRPELLNPDVGDCSKGGLTSSDDITDDQRELYRLRDGAGDKDIVLYFVANIFGSFLDCCAGCSIYPDGKPGAIIGKVAEQWTVAHEVGHVLGLDHVDDNPPRRLMTKHGTDKIVDPPPDLTASEKEKMHDSKYTNPV
jgi:hypothetical protein